MNAKTLICIQCLLQKETIPYFISKHIWRHPGKKQGNFSVTTQYYFTPTLGRGYLSDLVIFCEIELPGTEDVHYG